MRVCAASLVDVRPPVGVDVDDIVPVGVRNSKVDRPTGGGLV